MSDRPNVFIGSMDRVLMAMADHMPVHVVIASRGRLRNMRLEKQLRGSGTLWLEYTGREGFLEVIANIDDPGICAVAGFSWRLEQPFIDACELLVNIHPGDLLCCRGPQPIEAALYHRHTSLGVCAHIIDSEAMDAGPILHSDSLSVDPSKGYHWHKSQINHLTYKVTNRLMKRLAAGERPLGQHWDVDASHWYERLPREEVKAMVIAPCLADYYQQRSLN